MWRVDRGEALQGPMGLKGLVLRTLVFILNSKWKKSGRVSAGASVTTVEAL